MLMAQGHDYGYGTIDTFCFSSPSGMCYVSVTTNYLIT